MFVIAEVVSVDSELVTSPYKNIGTNWKTGLNIQHKDDVYASYIDSATGAGVTVELDDYVVANAVLHYLHKDLGEFSLNLDNIADARFEQGVGFYGESREVRLSWQRSW